MINFHFTSSMRFLSGVLLVFIYLTVFSAANTRGDDQSDQTTSYSNSFAFTEIFKTGEDWGSNAYTTSIAFGDVDGDNNKEVGIARHHGSNARYVVFDDGDNDFTTLWESGESWGSNAYATSIAFGDVDGDGKDEIGVARYAGSNTRFFVFDDASNEFTTLWESGESWGSNAYATSIAFGDVDGDGKDEVGVARYAGSNTRFFVFDDASNEFTMMWESGESWGSNAYATSIAFGDVDGDGKDEVGVARHAGSNSRFFVFDDAGNGFSAMWESGESWRSNEYATSISFGDIDGDGRFEVGVARVSTVGNARFFIYDDAANSFSKLWESGEDWGGHYYATSIAFGNVDGDNKDEIGVARYARENPRFLIYEVVEDSFTLIWASGEGWGSNEYATSIAFGDVNGDGKDEVGVGRYGEENARAFVFTKSLLNFLPVAISKD